MARVNTPIPTSTETTHEGGTAARLKVHAQLERSVLACLLWEKTFYEDGQDVATRIGELAAKADAEFVAELAVKARSEYRLRHAPLWLLVGMARSKTLKAATLAKAIQRADELTEFLAMYWKDGKAPIAAQVKKGLAEAFSKFDAYQLAKYDRANAIRLRDVLFMVHAKPKTAEQAETWKQLVEGTLPAPDTWEVGLSGGAGKRETFERLLREKKLGYMALLRNLRNMSEAGVDKGLIETALIEGAGRSRVLPFRFVAAAMMNPQMESVIERAMLAALEGADRIPGRTVLLIDVSGSMDAPLSTRSDLTRMKAATALAMLCREVCEEVAIYSFSDALVAIPDRRGFALGDAITGSQPHGGTRLGGAVEALRQNETGERLIVFTDEQSHDTVGGPLGKGYMVNVASYQNGVGYGPWTRITGFSEAVVDYIRTSERLG